MKTQLMLIRWRLHNWRENWMVRFTYHLPHWVKYWCAIHIATDATTGDYGDTDVTELKVVDMLKRTGN